jgi:hypothetical protein
MHPAVAEERKIHGKPDGFKLYKDDVWGAYDIESHERVADGLIVARSEERCPIFGDTVPYKSVTVVFDPEVHPYGEVCYWLSYVHGGQHSNEKTLEDGRIAIRSDYQCW